MSQYLDRRFSPPDNPEVLKQNESQRQSEKYLKLAQENPHAITEEIKKNPKTEPFLRKLFWDAEYERIKALNPKSLAEDASIASMQKEIYSFVDINPDTDRNSSKNKFIKWFIDSVVIENAELAKQVIESTGKILLDMISQILSWEWLKQIAEWLKTSVMGIFSGDAYKFGKSTGELGLITIGSGVGGFLLKKAGKSAIKAGEWAAIRAWEKTALSQTLAVWGGWVESLWKVVQAPYNGVKWAWGKVGEWIGIGLEKTGISGVVRSAIEPAKNMVTEWVERISPKVRKTMADIKQRSQAILAIAAMPLFVGSKDGRNTLWKIEGQIGAVGDVGKVKEWMFAKMPLERKKLWFDISKNEIYKEFPSLEKHADFLGELKSWDILGQWVNGIIVRHPNKPDIVVKVAKEWLVDDLGKEFSMTQEFYMTLEKGKKKHKWELSDDIRIPKVSEDPRHTGWYFLMERIEWQNLNTAFYREYYAETLSKKHTKSQLDALTDMQFDTLMKENKLYKVSPFTLAENDWEGRLLRSAMQKFYMTKLDNTELWSVLWFLEWSGYYHNDFRTNPWNIMVDKNWKMYIIDFWKAEIKSTK